MIHSQMEDAGYQIRQQVLNPNQRQQLEDNRRIKEQMEQLQKGSDINLNQRG